MRGFSRTLASCSLLLAWLGAGAAPGLAQAGRVDELRYPPLREIPIPQPERVVLDNGLVVMLLEDSELPLIEVTAVVRVGGRLDPAAEVGLGDLAGEVMRSGGTARLPGDALDDYLEDRAASIEVAVGDEMTAVNLSALKADFPDLLRVFADVLRRPAFDARKLDVAKNQAVASVARQNDNPQAIVFRELTELVYGADSPYAWTESYASLGNINRDDLLAWHRRHFHPDRVVLGLTGDFKKEEVLRQVREAFGDWPRGPKQNDSGVPFRTQPAPGVYHVAKEDVAQSFIALGHLGVRKDDPDYYALEVLNQVLSGSLASRLGAIRSRKGLAYSVFGQVGSDWDHPGLALLFVSTKRETTGAGIDALLEEIEKLRTEPPTDDEVEKARQGLLNSYVFSAESRRQVLSQQVAYEAYGYPLDWLSRYREGVEKVTTAQVRQAALRHLRRQDLAVLVVGPSEGLDKPLDTYGKVTPLDITIAPPKGQPAAGGGGAGTRKPPGQAGR
jgi:zinc protease